MKNRRKKIAVWLVVALIMQLICPSGLIKSNHAKALTSDNFHDDDWHGYKMHPYSVDLTGENTVSTGSAIEICQEDVFESPLIYEHYESLKFTYEIEFKDEKLKEKELADSGLPEDAWYFDTVECSFGLTSKDKLRRKGYSKKIWVNKTNLILALAHQDTYNYDDVFYNEYRLTLHNSYDGSWPLQVKSVRLISIRFIPYENIGVCDPVPTPSYTPSWFMPEYCYSTPRPPKPILDENELKNRKGKDFSIDLSRYQTEFTKYNCWIDLQDELNDSWYCAQDYSEIRLRYQLKCKEFDENESDFCESSDFLCQNLLIQAVCNSADLNGYSSNKTNYVNRPTAKSKNSQGEVSFVPYVKVDGTEKKIIGFNFRLMDRKGFCSWTKEVESIKITGIDFVANKNTPTPTVTVMPTVTPTITPTIIPTIIPIKDTQQIENEKLPLNTLSSTSAETVLPKVSNLKLNAGKKKQIKIMWNTIKQADGYEIYRSTKKNKGYQKLADGFKNKCSFTDSKIKYAKNYYYKVRAYCISGKNYQYGVFSDVKKLMLKRKAPAFKLKRKITTDGIHYISIRLKSCSDPYLQMWVRFGKKKYKKIPLSKHKIRKNATLNFKYTPGKGKISFRIRSYRVRNKKREYSKSKTKRI